MAQSNNNSRQGAVKCCGVLEKRENTTSGRGFLKKGALEDEKIRIEWHTEKGVPGEESHVNKGQEVRLLLLCVGTMQSSVRQKGCAGKSRS